MRRTPPVSTNRRDQMSEGGNHARAWQFTIGFSSALRRAHAVRSSPRPDITWYADQIVNLAVPAFCDHCQVDIVDSTGDLVMIAFRQVRCREHGDTHGVKCAPLDARDGTWHETVELAMVGGSEILFENGLLIVPIRVNDQQFGVISFSNDSTSSKLGGIESEAAQQVAWELSDAIERSRLIATNREAVRQTQRIARQLHQLIAASITVTLMRDIPEILGGLASSTRSVFDADVAVITLMAGASGPMSAIARRGRPVSMEVISPDVSTESPFETEGAVEPWVEGEWLVGPIVGPASRRLGLIAVRRGGGRGFSGEDREVVALLSQMASSALGSAELAKTIETNEERLRVLIEAAPIGIVEVDSQGVVQFWNRSASKILAWSTFDPAQPMDPRFPTDLWDDLSELWQSALTGGQTEARDVVGVEIAGRSRILTISAALASREGSAPGILTLVDDVTDHHELKAELRHAHTMEVRGQVASRIAHDFNNLLTLISGYAELLARDLAIDDHSEQLVRDIQATASRASLLTGQLQTIGRTKVPEPVAFDPIEVMQSNAEVLERILGSKIELHWDLDLDAGNVLVDADQFEQMILNLSINARDAMPDGGELRFGVVPRVIDPGDGENRGIPSGSYVRITVSDNGIGMNDDTLAKCFEPLFTTKGPFKGTGMGLSAARRLVEASGGAIECRSALGEGTIVDILLPVTDAPVREGVVDIPTVRAKADASVLVAEDDEGLRRLMSQVLRRNGYRVTDVPSGEAAQEVVLVAESPFDLLVSDVVMGEISGSELAGSIQKHWPEIKVLLISGTEDHHVTDGLRTGSADFLPKPFKPSALIDRVNSLLSRDATR